jgi:DNA-binding transcriptional ArsR family regulator
MSGADELLWTAVADPMRKRLLDLLLADGPMTATGLAAEMPVTRQAVSKHLAVLERAGLVACARSGRELRWQVVLAGVDAATHSMARAAAAWDERLAALKQLGEPNEHMRKD